MRVDVTVMNILVDNICQLIVSIPVQGFGKQEV